MRVYLYPTSEVERHVVRICAGEDRMTVCLPLRVDDQIAAVRRIAGVLSPEALKVIWNAYGTDDLESFLAVLAGQDCRICEIPYELRLLSIPWPECPEHGAHPLKCG